MALPPLQIILLLQLAIWFLTLSLIQVIFAFFPVFILLIYEWLILMQLTISPLPFLFFTLTRLMVQRLFLPYLVLFTYLRLFLTYIIYIPKFKFNLLLVTRLNASFPCSFIFYKQMYFIQSLKTLKKLDTTMVHNGLYTINVTARCTTLSSSTSSFDLWHFRLRHSSHSKLQSIQLLSGYSFISNEHCEICH